MKIVLAIGILVIAKSQLHAAISTRYLCPQRWTPGDKSCSSKFNSTNYCAALIMCRFYNSHLLNTTSSSIENITERVWIYGSGVFQSWQNLSCSSNPSNGLVSDCPIRTLIATTDSEPCNATNRYYCEFKRQPVALGLQSGVISKQQLSSSSFYVSVNEPIGYESQFARLGNSFTVGTVIQGGWCSKTASHGEYIQVDFGKVVLLTRIATQGVRGRHCDYWTTSFNMKFKTGFGTWISYSQKLSGNKESSNTVLSHLSKPVIAKSFRIYPISFASSCRKATGRFCLRLEAYGIDFRRNPSKRVSLNILQLPRQMHCPTRARGLSQPRMVVKLLIPFWLGVNSPPPPAGRFFSELYKEQSYGNEGLLGLTLSKSQILESQIFSLERNIIVILCLFPLKSIFICCSLS